MSLGSQDNSERELLRRAVQRDREAFGDLYGLYLEPIYRYIYYRVSDEFEAEDLTEKVFLNAWEALSSINLDGFNFRAWIYRIAHNLIVDRHRTSRPSVSIDEMDQTLPTPSSDNPEAVYQRIETERQLTEIIHHLEPNLQNVVIFRFVIGLSHSETAEIMNLTEVYIRVLQHRALKKIRDVLSRKQIEDERSDRHHIS